MSEISGDYTAPVVIPDTTVEPLLFLDSQLFLRLDSAELLLWVQEQSEEKSVNLTKFTEHFNNMSYWARTLILQQPDPKVLTSNTEPAFISFNTIISTAGARAILDEIHQDHEVAEKNEQFQLLLGDSLGAGLGSSQTPGLVVVVL